MKRWGYDPLEGKVEALESKTENMPDDSQSTIISDNKNPDHVNDAEPSLWGLDLEALRSRKEVVPGHKNGHTGLPIYAAESARAYLLKSFASAPSSDSPKLAFPKKKPSAAVVAVEKERNLGNLLQSLDMLYASWVQVLSTEELDRRAWSWYVAVRPEVQDGVAGWGGKGEVKLGKILEMRRKG